jgi:hypothetical protein
MWGKYDKSHFACYHGALGNAPPNADKHGSWKQHQGKGEDFLGNEAIIVETEDLGDSRAVH